MDISAILFDQLRRYPGMALQDLVKCLYQSEMGEAPQAPLSEDSRLLAQELALAELAGMVYQPPENIGNNRCRVHLSGFDKGLSGDTFARLCERSAALHPGSLEQLDQNLEVLLAMAGRGQLPYPAQDVDRFVADYRVAGLPSLPHTSRFTALYKPHYRVMDTASALFLPVLAAIDTAMAQKSHVLVGIDGMSGSGKSMLAKRLAGVYGCGVVHTDDFFLRSEQKTAERLARPGGNIDYERLAPVARSARDDRAFHYQAYDCVQEKMSIFWQIPAGRLTVLEGSYALHPQVGAECDVRIFLMVDARVQAARVAARSGAEQACRFEKEWIPMENQYFSHFGIRESCDIVVDTSYL